MAWSARGEPHTMSDGGFMMLTKFKGGLTFLHEPKEDAASWLNSVTTSALAK